MDRKAKEDNSHKFLAQNTQTEELNTIDEVMSSIDEQNEVDSLTLSSRNDKTFQQCSSIGNIYSDEELNEDLQELNG
jgi:hypothetical protein